MKNKKFVLLAFVSFIALKGIGQNAFTLQEAVDYALKNNASYLNAQLESQIGVAKKNEVRGIGLPQVSGSFDVKDFLEIPTSVVPGENFGAPSGTLIPIKFGIQYNATAGVTVSQIIFSSDYLVALQASKTFLELSEKVVQRSKTEVTVNVSKAYYAVLVNRERMKLLIANVNQLEKLLKDTRVLNQNGFVEKIDADRVEVALNNLVSEKEKVEKLIGLTESLLKFQMGLDISQAIALKDSMNIHSIPAITVTESTSLDFKNRVEYSLLQTQRSMNLLDFKRNRLSYLPSLVAYGSASAQAMRQEFTVFNTAYRWYPVAVIGATLNVPIFSGGQNMYKIQQSKLNLLITDNNIKNLENAIRLEVSSAKISYQNAYSSISTQRKNMELAQGVYDVTKKKYEQGVGSNLEVINAETALKESQTNFFNAVYDYYIAKIEYDKANGNIK